MAWDPGVYLRFADERLRPARDLLIQVPLSAPSRVADLGCGSGQVTALLRARYPDAAVHGIDTSEAMLARAEEAAPGCTFSRADVATWTPDAPLELIFSNAALHWVGGHAALFPRLIGFLAPGGVLAVQMPDMHDAPLRTLAVRVAGRGPWASHLTEVVPAPPIHAPAVYWDLLSPLCAEFDVWQTIYTHVLHGRDPVLTWAAGASLAPFLEALPPALTQPFEYAYADAVRPHYPARPDGATLLPFRRLFMVAQTRAGTA